MSYSEKELDKLRDAIENVRCYSDVLDDMEKHIVDLNHAVETITGRFINLEDEHEQLKLDYAESVKERLELADVIKTLQNELDI
jgi:predicted  nucleic acid-binding Zn-ribbon protein